MKFSLGIILSIFAYSSFNFGQKLEFVIVVPSYNNEKYAKDNLRSICHQKSSRPYEVICIDDCSTDQTGKIMDRYVKKHKLESFVTIIHNTNRMGALANIYNTIHAMIPDNKVVVLCDGDDIFAHNDVLHVLEKVYKDPDVWITYGSTLSIPAGTTQLSRQIPERIFEQKELRSYHFVSQHLRTFKAGLFKKIKKEDLLYEGKFFTMTWDMAFMFPMLEMAAPKAPGEVNHSKYIRKILYIYRTNTGLNDHSVDRELQKKLERVVRQMKPYEPIDSLGNEV